MTILQRKLSLLLVTFTNYCSTCMQWKWSTVIKHTWCLLELKHLNLTNFWYWRCMCICGHVHTVDMLKLIAWYLDNWKKLCLNNQLVQTLCAGSRTTEALNSHYKKHWRRIIIIITWNFLKTSWIIHTIPTVCSILNIK